MSWRDLVGSTGRCVSLEHYGASADFATIYREFGITAEAVALAAEGSIADSRADRPIRHRHTENPGGTRCPIDSRLWQTQGYPSGWTTCPASASRPGTSPTW